MLYFVCVCVVVVNCKMDVCIFGWLNWSTAIITHEKKIGHRDCSPWAHSELIVSSRWPKWSQPAVTEPWPGPWLSCDLAVTEPWSYLKCRYWAVTSPWLSCDLAVTELWPLLALSEPWSLGPEPWPPWSPWAHGDIFFLMGTFMINSLELKHASQHIWLPWYCLDNRAYCVCVFHRNEKICLDFCIRRLVCASDLTHTVTIHNHRHRISV